ncbi:MAG: hypothetical protein Q4G68_11680 [Planctomycetia bacterium]|nr:hypothetical protein [Planctomycetia bacterium]
MRRRIEEVLLILGMIILGVAWTARVESAEIKYESDFYLSPTDEGRTAWSIKPGDVVSGLLEWPRALTSFGVRCPSYGNNKGNLRLSLYKWRGTVESTCSAAPVASATFTDFLDNDLLRLRFERQKAGTWYWTLDEATEEVGVWQGKEWEDSVKSQSFFNGEPVAGNWDVMAGGLTPSPYSGTLADYESLYKGKATCPTEPRETHAIAALDVEPDTWSGVDGLGRELPGLDQTGPVRKDRQVGMFYWTWHEKMARDVDRPYDVSKILAEHPEAAQDGEHEAWGAYNKPHHWGEPLFGYYTTLDRWVLRKHAQMLAAAGVDVVIFDCTNGTWTWMDSTLALLETYAQARKDGVKTPKIAFMLPFWNLEWTRTDLVQLWRDIYRDGRFKELWFYWQGRPLIYGLPESLKERGDETPDERAELNAIRKFFSFRPGQPAYTGGPRRADNWSWLEVFPQNGYGQRADGQFDMICVGVAQNHSSGSSDGHVGLAAMNDRNAFGRAYVVGEEPDPRPDAFLYGGNFQQQWNRALELDPAFVFVTGWNEWIAGRHPEWCGLKNAFPDEYNPEFSRDIEPSRGILKDHFYMQLVANVRKFKGTRPTPVASEPVSIDVNRGADAPDPWHAVTPVFRDWTGDTMTRNSPGYGDTHYQDATGRNDIVQAQVTRDTENLYFRVETREPLTPATDDNWMPLFISVAGRTETGWESFQYVVGRVSGEGPVAVEESTGGWNWRELGRVTRRISGNCLELAIPRSFLDLQGQEQFSIQFKWSDNVPTDGDVLEFYTTGDAAPDGRFTWTYRVE